jgi:hypothetical protein
MSDASDDEALGLPDIQAIWPDMQAPYVVRLVVVNRVNFVSIG